MAGGIRRGDVAEAVRLANKVLAAMRSFPLKLVVRKKYKEWVKAIRDILRDVMPLIPE